MRIDTVKPNILRIAYHQTEGDEHYGSCLWANFDIDLDTDTLTITSDCGNYAYGYWSVGPGGFLRFLCGLDDHYLLDKLAKRHEFDLEATVEGMKEILEGTEEFSKKQIELMIQNLREIMEYRGENGQTEYGALERWNKEHNLNLCDLWEDVVYDYHPYIKRIVRIFVDHIQPRIREIVEAGGQFENRQG